MDAVLRRLLLVAVLGTCLAQNALAEDSVATLAYSLSFPGSNMQDYIDETSYLGLEFSVRTSAWNTSPILVGVTMGWQVFDFETSDLIQLESGAVSGQQRRYLNVVPILLTAHYYLGPRDSWRVFAGVGAGTTYVLQTFQIGVYNFENGDWHLAVSPEAGFQFPVGDGTALYASGRYNYAFESGESLGGREVAWNHWIVDVGFVWSNW